MKEGDIKSSDGVNSTLSTKRGRVKKETDSSVKQCHARCHRGRTEDGRRLLREPVATETSREYALNVITTRSSLRVTLLFSRSQFDGIQVRRSLIVSCFTREEEK